MTDATNAFSKRLERLEKDMWYGNGKPGITTRMESAEARMTTMEKYIQEKDNRIFVRMNLVIGSCFTLAIAILLEIIFRH